VPGGRGHPPPKLGGDRPVLVGQCVQRGLERQPGLAVLPVVPSRLGLFGRQQRTQLGQHALVPRPHQVGRKDEAEPLAGSRWRGRRGPKIDAMTKELRTAWLRIGVAVVLIASSIVVFVLEQTNTTQLVLQSVVLVCGLGLLVQGIATIVTQRRR
jgi:hypothetical protein